MIVKNLGTYDGAILQDRFAYDFFKDKVLRTGNIITWIAAAEVTEKYMVDKEDLVNKDFIFSEKMIHFCFEIPDIDLFGGVCFQRLFCSTVGNILASKYVRAPAEIDGDDVFILKEHNQGGIVQQRGKASVSIVKWVNNAVLGHLGINVVAGKKAPAFAYSTNLNTEQCEQFMREVVNCFYGMSHDVFLATTKLTK